MAIIEEYIPVDWIYKELEARQKIIDRLSRKIQRLKLFNKDYKSKIKERDIMILSQDETFCNYESELFDYKRKCNEYEKKINDMHKELSKLNRKIRVMKTLQGSVDVYLCEKENKNENINK